MTHSDVLISVVYITHANELTDLYIDENITWNSDTDLSMYENVYIVDDAMVTITSGSTIKMRNIAVYDRGRIISRGTADKPITITQLPIDTMNNGDYDPECSQPRTGTISFETDAESPNESIFTYTVFKEMGTFIDLKNGEYHCPALVQNKRLFPSFINTAYAAKPAEYYDPKDDEVKTAPAIYFGTGRVHMDNCTFEDNAFADVLIDAYIDEDADFSTFLTIENSNFHNNKNNIAVRSRVEKMTTYSNYFYDCYDTCMNTLFPELPWWVRVGNCSMRCLDFANNEESLFDEQRVLLKNNWYGHENGPDTTSSEWDGEGSIVYGSLIVDGFRPTSDMASNVLFLPGIKASRLDLDSGDQVWLPEKEEDTHHLGMSEEGESANDIHAKNIVESAYGVVPVYDEFVEDLHDLKNDHIITDFTNFAYDWRYDVEHIVQSGAKYPNGEVKNPITEVERLAQTSVSGKVTIVAHSNGGLLAKAIMQELERQGKTDLVDNIITVSSPQMGTPKATAALLHGYDEKIAKSFITLMSDEQARMIMRNMPGAYGLLPSKEYFSRTGEPIIDFDATVDEYKKYKDAYGKNIDSFDEFRDFALAKKDNREKPSYHDLVSANVLNEHIFDRADDLHDRIDTWTPPENVKLIQIGGWGLDTMQGMTYTMKEKEQCTIDLPFVKGMCQPTGEFESFMEPQFTVDGDETVTTPSSLMLPVADNVERYWVDLFSVGYGYFNSDRNHKDIMEIDELRQFVVSYIKKHSVPEEIPQYISEIRPNEVDSMEHPIRIRMSLYSPLDIHLYDEHGNHTGTITQTVDGQEIKIIEENIPNSYYITVGEHKYVGWGTSDDVRVELDGYDDGSYAVNLQEIFVTEDGEDAGITTEFASLPTSENTSVVFTIPAEGVGEMSDLTADYDGDGVTDYVVIPQINGSASLSDDDDRQDDDVSDETTEDIKSEKKKKYKKASISNWEAYQYTTYSDSCPIKLAITLTGKHFDKDAIIRIGDVKAKKIKRNNSKKLTAIFCMKDLQRVKIKSLRTISVTNPHAKRDKAGKKIDVENVLKRNNK